MELSIEEREERLLDIIERVMTEHWDIGACPCQFCVDARAIGCRPRQCFETNPRISCLDDRDPFFRTRSESERQAIREFKPESAWEVRQRKAKKGA